MSGGTLLMDKQPAGEAEIQAWLVAHIADVLEIADTDIDVEAPFDSYALDSVAAVEMTGALEDWLQSEVDPTLAYDYPTIASLARHLSAELRLRS